MRCASYRPAVGGNGTQEREDVFLDYSTSWRGRNVIEKEAYEVIQNDLPEFFGGNYTIETLRGKDLLPLLR